MKRLSEKKKAPAEKPLPGKKPNRDDDNFVEDERGQTQPANKEQAQTGGPLFPGQPAGGE